MAILTINGEAMPSPKEMKISYAPVGKSESNAAGDTVMDRIALKRTLKATWAYLTALQAASLIGTAQDDYFMTAAYVDPMTGASYSGTFYVKSCELEVVRYEGDVPTAYRDVTITLAEQ